MVLATDSNFHFVPHTFFYDLISLIQFFLGFFYKISQLVNWKARHFLSVFCSLSRDEDEGLLMSFWQFSCIKVISQHFLLLPNFQDSPKWKNTGTQTAAALSDPVTI